MSFHQLISQRSFCDTNLYSGDVKTLADVLGVEFSCPNLVNCKKSGYIGKDGHQCVMLMASHVARFTIDDETSVEQEMEDLKKSFRLGDAFPLNGWIYSEDGINFMDNLSRDDAIEKIEETARMLLSKKTEKEKAPDSSIGSSFSNVVSSATDPKTGIIDLSQIDRFEGRCGTNGGRGCDVTNGPCSCGAWH